MTFSAKVRTVCLNASCSAVNAKSMDAGAYRSAKAIPMTTI
jgi:hypothetical protein